MKFDKFVTKVKKNWIITVAVLVVLIIIIVGTILYLNKSEDISTIRKSVVKINVYDDSGEVIQTGSGLIVFDKNILVTNAHVITGGTTADSISESDEKIYIDGAIYYNQDEDIAILKLNNQNSIKPLKISTKYKVGDKVVAIGSPLGIKNSVSDGMISNILDNKTIQHSAPISPGSSGGALFNSKGRVIGINTATITSGQNINLAIPIQKVKLAYNESKNNKIKTVKNVQYLSDERLNENVKSVMLNNNAGKELVELFDKYKSSDLKVYFEDFGDLNNYNKEYYLYKLSKEGYVTDWIKGTVSNEFDDNDKLVESKIALLEITEVSDNSEDLISYIESQYSNDIKSEYAELLKNSNFSAMKGSCDPETHECRPAREITGKFSNDYINAYRNSTISHYGNYVYAIVSKDDTVVKQIERIIKNLP